MNIRNVMKRLMVSILAWMTVFGLVVTDAVYASPDPTVKVQTLYLADVPALPGQDWMTQLETEVLPKIEEIFNPQQREQFQSNMSEGMSFRKAFKSLMLTPEQKTQIKSVLQSFPKKDALASLTPEQKKQMYMKKKEMFMPSAEEITAKIENSFKEKGVELPAGIKEKIDAGLKMKDNFIPTAEEITEKIEAEISTIKKKLED